MLAASKNIRSLTLRCYGVQDFTTPLGNLIPTNISYDHLTSVTLALSFLNHYSVPFLRRNRHSLIRLKLDYQSDDVHFIPMAGLVMKLSRPDSTRGVYLSVQDQSTLLRENIIRTSTGREGETLCRQGWRIN